MILNLLQLPKQPRKPRLPPDNLPSPLLAAAIGILHQDSQPRVALIDGIIHFFAGVVVAVQEGLDWKFGLVGAQG